VLRAATAQGAGGSLDWGDIERALLRLGSTEGDDAPPRAEGLAELVASHRGNLSAAARALGVPRSTLRDRLREG
jgi:transcriptional regulator of acetoin/glycerol metabolism